MLKLEIMRQLEDENPLFTCLIKSYKVKRSSVAQAPYYAIDAWERNKKPIEPLMKKQ